MRWPAPDPTSPYFCRDTTLLSFSGGRTSGRMLYHVVEAHGGVLPDYVYVCFANTGKEKEETLRFVHECASRWGIKVRWLEFWTDLKSVGPAGRFIEVGYNSASRDGEPLDRLIERKQALFSTVTGRWCTERCKVGAMHDFMEAEGFARGEYVEMIGFRADEYDRVFELPRKPRNATRRFCFPLAVAEVRKGDVLTWWEAMPFNLMLDRGTGNCDHCPFLSRKIRIDRARRDPAGLGWWARHEARRNFSFGYESFAQILQHIGDSPRLPLDDLEEDWADSECGAWCGEEE